MLKKVFTQQSRTMLMKRATVSQSLVRFQAVRQPAATSISSVMNIPMRGFYYPDANHHHLQQEVSKIITFTPNHFYLSIASCPL